MVFSQLLKSFVLSDLFGAHPIVTNLLKDLHLFGVPDSEKTQFFVSLVQDIMLGNGAQNFSNFIAFVKSDAIPFTAIDDLLSEYRRLFQCDAQ